MVIWSARHYGQSEEHWERTLTLRRHRAHLKDYRSDPPPEFFLNLYFRAHEMWEPPEIEGSEALEQIPENERPEYEP